MANDTALSQRIRPMLAQRNGVTERKMFGGVGFMINGNMCVGTWKGSLIVRLDRNDYRRMLAEPHAKPADMNGRTMRGWVRIEPAGVATENDLAVWVERAVVFTESLPAK